ncbi:flavin reductase family protein [Streptomyces sp. BI20]|uniref:flavin reductase family protein n=1 Tax=Streptomyces sp. BI20 TaxID=3403460 RepID=UPI003C779AB7
MTTPSTRVATASPEAPAGVPAQGGRAASGAHRPGSPDLLRAAFRQHAAGVAVITGTHPVTGVPVGFTATSLNSVSAEPPLLSFSIGTGSSSWPAVSEEGSGLVGVHVLGEEQGALAGLFARSGADRFGPGTGWAPGPHGVPVLAGAQAWLVCRIRSRIAAGEHRVIIAEVVAGAARGEGRPLLYHQGRFNALRD